jgi:hypothetical protein
MTHRRARLSPSECGHLATPTPVRRLSPSRSNLGGGGHLANLRLSLALAAVHSTHRAPTTKVHGTPSVVAGYGRRSTRSVMLHTIREPPYLQMLASSRRLGSVLIPMTRAPPGGTSWWFQGTNRHGSARQTPRRHARSRAMPTTPRVGWESSSRRYPRVPLTYVSSSKRWGC